MNAPLPLDSMPQLPNQQPAWKVYPAAGKCSINSVTVSADGSAVVGGSGESHISTLNP
jgi:hypothetical protein